MAKCICSACGDPIDYGTICCICDPENGAPLATITYTLNNEQICDLYAKDDYGFYKSKRGERAQEIVQWYEKNKAHLIGE